MTRPANKGKKTLQLSATPAPWRNGRRSGLKTHGRKASRFDPGRGYQPARSTACGRPRASYPGSGLSWISSWIETSASRRWCSAASRPWSRLPSGSRSRIRDSATAPPRRPSDHASPPHPRRGSASGGAGGGAASAFQAETAAKEKEVEALMGQRVEPEKALEANRARALGSRPR